MKKDILFLTATHGDEDIGVKAVKQLENIDKFDYLLSNPKAFKKKC